MGSHNRRKNQLVKRYTLRNCKRRCECHTGPWNRSGAHCSVEFHQGLSREKLSPFANFPSASPNLNPRRPKVQQQYYGRHVSDGDLERMGVVQRRRSPGRTKSTTSGQLRVPSCQDNMVVDGRLRRMLANQSVRSRLFNAPFVFWNSPNSIRLTYGRSRRRIRRSKFLT